MFKFIVFDCNTQRSSVWETTRKCTMWSWYPLSSCWLWSQAGTVTCVSCPWSVLTDVTPTPSNCSKLKGVSCWLRENLATVPTRACVWPWSVRSSATSSTRARHGTSASERFRWAPAPLWTRTVCVTVGHLFYTVNCHKREDELEIESVYREAESCMAMCIGHSTHTHKAIYRNLI